MTTRSRLLRATALVGGFAFLATGCGSDTDDAVEADANGEIVIDMGEFTFGLDLIEVHPGQTVTFVLVNSGDNEHEFMVGRDLVETDLGHPNGFELDFFAAMTPVVDPPSAGMDMGMDMSAEEMDMTEDEHADMDMSAEEMDMTEDEHADEDDHGEMDMGGVDLHGMDHAGFMVERKPGEVARITITIPEDALGEWEIGCFRGRGSHWDAGMRARLLVTRA